MERHSFAAARRPKCGSGQSGFRPAEPVAEPLQKRRYIRWSALDEEAFLETVRAIALEKGISGMGQMKRKDNSMFRAVKERGLEGKIFGNGHAEPGAERPVERKAEAEPPAPDGAARKECAGPPGASAGPGFGREEVRELLQSIIDGNRLREMEELREIEPEFHDLAREMGLDGELAFSREEKPPESGGAREAAGEDQMYRLICSECFRAAGGNPFIGNRRGTIPVLQAGMNSRLKGAEHRLFRKCWDRMVAEGAITYNTNKSAASLSVSCTPRTDGIAQALGWALTVRFNSSRAEE